MDFEKYYARSPLLLMEGALGERLKREYALVFDEQVAMAGLVYQEEGRRALRALWLGYAAIAQAHGLPFLATTPTRRANRERVERSLYDAGILEENLRFLREVRREQRARMFVGGLMGCRGDAYSARDVLCEEEALRFHAWQAERMAGAGADFLYAGIMPALAEAKGMARAMAATGVPYIISLYLDRSGRLPDGTRLHDAIAAVDSGAAPPPVCYMTNCVHPQVLLEALEQPFNRTELVRTRFHGIQANASPLTAQELDGSAQLLTSPPEELAEGMLALKGLIDLRIAGGCCGTDDAHIEAIAARLAPR